jgi:hypothetical protein
VGTGAVIVVTGTRGRVSSERSGIEGVPPNSTILLWACSCECIPCAIMAMAKAKRAFGFGLEAWVSARS